MIRHIIELTALSTLAAFTHSAVGVVIMFENDPLGPVANGFMSVDSPLVSFTDTDGSNLVIGNFGVESIGQGLAVGVNDTSALLMNFSMIIDSLSVDFGNDDPALTSPGDYCVLSAFLGAVKVGQTLLEMNRDDVMNQTITVSGVLFDSASLEYYVSSDGLTKVVDNITFSVIPAPGGLVLLGLMICGSRRRRG